MSSTAAFYVAVIAHLMDRAGDKVVNIDTREIRQAAVQVHFNGDHDVTIIRGEPGCVMALTEGKPS